MNCFKLKTILPCALALALCAQAGAIEPIHWRYYTATCADL